MNAGAILHILGWLVLACGGAQLLPFLLSVGYGDSEASIFLYSALFSGVLGGLTITATQAPQGQFTTREGILLTVLCWLVLSILCAVPLYFSGATATVADAWFESVSGLTTTGATVMFGLDYTDHGILFWRALLQWFGGMGIVLLAVAVLPLLGVGGMQLYKAELPGVSKDKLRPRLQSTAKLLWMLYLGLTALCIISYAFAGMSLFDAVCHAFTTVATGGFSTKDSSIGAFNNATIEYIAIVFMLLGSINFAMHFRFLQKPTFATVKDYWNDEEIRFFICFILLLGSAFALLQLTMGTLTTGALEQVRDAFFTVISILTTTGYSTTDYALWAAPIPFVLMMIMFAGGTTGSTAGGMKMLRLLVLMKLAIRELFRLIHPKAIVPIKIGGMRVMPEIQQTIWAFLGIYLMTYMVLTILVNMTGVDITNSLAAVATTLTNAGVGPGIGQIGPSTNFAWLPESAKMILSFGMLLGRLELFTFLVLLSPAFWRK
jgi:trk system potassium uptake protein TrkH